MAGNKSLNAAAAAKQDEFYTQITDIEKELRHYRKHFAGKTILCNCDDPFESNFFKYFVLNFNRLGLGNIAWFTNLDIKKRHEDIILVKRYEAENYPQYVNYNGIDVSKISEIPYDYTGVMGVPITFMQHHNPEQFEIIGLGTGEIAKSLGVTKNYRGRTDISYQRKDGTFTCPYERVLIRNLHPEEAK